ncbi:MAG TPA: NB-ARC domain-containing protein [Nakamurella sp.]|nr:NB-ARC domain-containing protein [Nakamurella sp.]
MTRSAEGGAGAGSTVFVSYSRQDAQWVRRFRVMLRPVVDLRRLELWVDDRIAPGERWRSELKAAIARSGVALLLLTPEFLASRFIMGTELPALAKAGVRLVPVLVEPCLWRQVPSLLDLQWAHDPARDGPLAAARGAQRNERIVRICDRLIELLPRTPKLTAGSTPPSTADGVAAREVVVTTALSRGGRPGRADGVPPLPRFHAPRAELAQLRAALLDPGSGAVGVTGGVHDEPLAGQGGIGKSVLAAELALDPDTAGFFPDGIFWVTLGQRADLVGTQLDLLRRLGASSQEARTPLDGARVLRAALADRQCLLVVDDVWTVVAAEAFRVTGPPGRVLFTSRNPVVLTTVDVRVQRLDVLPDRAARGLLAALTRTQIDDLPPVADRVLAQTGRVALAVALAGAAVRGGTGWAQIATALDRGTETFRGHPFANTFKALQAATETLTLELADAFYSLAVYPADTCVPVAAVVRYWSRLRDRTPAATREDLLVLHDRGLLILDDEQISFHDLPHDYLLLQVEDLTGLHVRLLDGYRAVLPAGQHRWFALPRDEPYIWDHLLHHLRGAGRWPELLSTVTDLAYLVLACTWPARMPPKPTWAPPPRPSQAARTPGGCGSGWHSRRPYSPVCPR